MKINKNTALSTNQILLVPYCSHHVPTYHAWMQDPDLQASTASEPLSLDAEYAMQKSWREDNDKLTFIICLPLSERKDPVTATVDDASDRMLGDINLFLFPPDDGDDNYNNENGGEVSDCVVGEIELMIARSSFQRKGYGRAALLTFLEYILKNWSSIGDEYSNHQKSADKSTLRRLAFLRVKIQKSNVGSLKLFENVGFVRIAEEANYFGEVELRMSLDETLLSRQEGWEEVEVLEYRSAGQGDV